MTAIQDIGAVRLHSGFVLPDVQVAYTCHGTLAADGRNAILVTHGFTSSHGMIEGGHQTAEGSWAQLLGPGKPLDTDRYFIVCSNMLGSSFGTTGPRSINPATGKPWGPDFPDIRLEDIVTVQHRLLATLGVTHLRAVIGPSYGGWQALQWALDHPAMVDAIGVISSGFQGTVGVTKASQTAMLAQYPWWQEGWYQDQEGVVESLRELRRATMTEYGLERLLQDRIPDPQARQDAIFARCQGWAAQWDPNSLVVLAGAAEHVDVRARLPEIRARVLMLQCTTDTLFPASEESRALLAQVNAPTRYIRLESPYGHMAASANLADWQGEIVWLLSGD